MKILLWDANINSLIIVIIICAANCNVDVIVLTMAEWYFVVPKSNPHFSSMFINELFDTVACFTNSVAAINVILVFLLASFASFIVLAYCNFVFL